MLEMGRVWNTPGKDGKIFCKPFSPDDRAMWFKDRISAVFSTVAGVIPVSSLLKVPVAAGILDVVSSPIWMSTWAGAWAAARWSTWPC
jgi:cholesterol oxidase